MKRNELIGAWRLDRIERHLADGTRADGFGSDPQGLLIYTADGHMSAQMTQSGRAPFSTPRETSLQAEHGEPDEIVAAFNSYVAYAGRFTFDEEAGQVRHHIDMALAPDMIGRTIVRHVESTDAHSLVLTAPSLNYDGLKSDVRVEWARADEAEATAPCRSDGYSIMRRYLDAIVARDVDTLADLHTDDTVLEYPFAPEGHPRRVEGHAKVMDLFAASFSAKHPRAYTDLKVRLTADGDAAVVEFNGELSLVSTGEIYRNSYFAFVEFRDGKIAVFREYYDAAIRAAKDPMRAEALQKRPIRAQQ